MLVLRSRRHGTVHLVELLGSVSAAFVVRKPLAGVGRTISFFRSNGAASLVLTSVHLASNLDFRTLGCTPTAIPVVFAATCSRCTMRTFGFGDFSCLLGPLSTSRLRTTVSGTAGTNGGCTSRGLQRLFSSLRGGRFHCQRHFLLPCHSKCGAMHISSVGRVRARGGAMCLHLGGKASRIIGVSVSRLRRRLGPSYFFHTGHRCVVGVRCMLFLSGCFKKGLVIHLGKCPGAGVAIDGRGTRQLGR